MRVPLLPVALLLPLAGCVGWFFTGEHHIDRSRPVALVETTGGIEFGATTEFGVLTLGRSATDGPCRVHYFLGPTPIVDDGALAATASQFTRAEIDLKTMAVRVCDRAPTAHDRLLAMWTPDGVAVETVPVRLAQDPGVAGDVLQHPGRDLPAGAAVLVDTIEDGLQFLGLIAGKATLAGDGAAREYYVFAGFDRVREMVAVPEAYPIDLVPKYRLDDITVMKPRDEVPPK
jgi:hypothetical protein